MSVYSGFCTRQLESTYNKTLYNLLFLLQYTTVHTLTQPEQLDQNQVKLHFIKNYRKLISLETNKYLPPKFSFALRDIAQHYGILLENEDIKFQLSANRSHFSSGLSVLLYSESISSN